MQIGNLYQSVTTVKKNCLYISTKENKAIVRQKQLYPIASFTKNNDKLYFDVKETSPGQLLFHVMVDYGFIVYGLHLGFYEYHTPEEIQAKLESIPKEQLTYEYMRDTIIQKANNNQFVNVAEIKLLEIAGENQELINMLINARQEYINTKQEKEKQEYNNRVKRAKQEYSEIMKDYNKSLIEAEKAILNKLKVNNRDIILPKLDGTYVYQNNRNLILELFKKHNIKVPLKTQGWINKALAEIKFNLNTEIAYSYFSSSKNSTVFIKYLRELEEAIQKEYKQIEVTKNEEWIM